MYFGWQEGLFSKPVDTVLADFPVGNGPKTLKIGVLKPFLLKKSKKVQKSRKKSLTLCLRCDRIGIFQGNCEKILRGFIDRS